MIKIHKLEKAEVYDAEILDAMDNIRNVICRTNDIDTADVTLHVFDDKMINAFAPPGGHIVVNTG